MPYGTIWSPWAGSSRTRLPAPPFAADPQKSQATARFTYPGSTRDTAVGYYAVTTEPSGSVAAGAWRCQVRFHRTQWLRPAPRSNKEGAPMSDYSLELNEDQLQIVKWVHEFAENVVRPAGPEWDEREETPWPIIQEAAKNGLYSFDFIAQCFSDPTGLLMCLVNEEMSWGDAGIGLAIFGSTLAVAGIFANGTPDQIGEWIPQCFGTPDDVKLAAFGVSEPDAGSDVSSLKSRRRLRRGQGRMGPERHEDVDHERRHRQHRTCWFSRSTRRSGAGARPASSCRRGRQASPRARSSRRWASGRRTRPKSCSTIAGCRVAASSAARRSWTSAWPGPRKASGRPPRPPWPPSRRRARLWERRPSGSPGPLTSTPSTTPRSASSSAGPSSRTRPSPSSWPT